MIVRDLHIKVPARQYCEPTNKVKTHSFQYGFNVRLITLVVWICSESTETIAKGSGSRKRSRLMSESAATTVGQRWSEADIYKWSLTRNANLSRPVVIGIDVHRR